MPIVHHCLRTFHSPRVFRRFFPPGEGLLRQSGLFEKRPTQSTKDIHGLKKADINNKNTCNYQLSKLNRRKTSVVM